MPKNHPFAPFDKSDPRVLDRLARFQLVSIVVVATIAVATLSAWLLTDFGILVPAFFTLMKVNTCLAVLASVCSLGLTQPKRSSRFVIFGRGLAVLVFGLAVLNITERMLGISLPLDTLLASDPTSPSHHPGLMSLQAGFSFALLGIVLFFVRCEKGVMRYVADLALIALTYIVLVNASGFLFGATSPLHAAAANWTSPQTLISLLLLSFATIARRSDLGLFSVLVGNGMGSEVSRVLTPIFLLLPFLREFLRSRLVIQGTLFARYTNAVFATTAAFISISVVMILAWRINVMEAQIHAVSLRDELTGLLNLRGFRVLAEHGFRQARRSQTPFSVLFVDVDNLKEINDRLGHQVGSNYLVETADLLRMTFRESDVLGRVGGDEFAVSGHFSARAIALAAERLQKNLESRQAKANETPLSLSVGYTTSDVSENDTLEDLLSKADEAMYEQKRSKKVLARQGKA